MITGRILLTGGSGTLGRATLLLARREGWLAKFTVFARSESRLARLKRAFPEVTTVVGDIRDKSSVDRAVSGHDVVLHMAAMKRIPECEQNAPECVQVNVLGTENVLRSCVRASVRDCVVISTDKACQAATVYGASKLLTEGLMTTYAKEFPKVGFHGVRYGNVAASNGSVVQLWEEQSKRGQPLSITSREMTRFWMSPYDAVKLIDYSLKCESGTICVPKMRALSIELMAHYLYPGQELMEVGLRSNEKLSEDLLHPYEPVRDTGNLEPFLVSTLAEPRWSVGWSYTSATAPVLDRDELTQMLADAAEVESCW